MSRVAALPLLLFCLSAPLRSQSTAELAREVFVAESSFAAAFARRDVAGFAQFLAPEAIFYGGEHPARGREAVVTSWRPLLESAAPPFSWRPESVEVLASGTLALSSGPVLNPAGERTATFNSVWRREPDGSWRVVFDKGCGVCRCGGGQ